jgi:peroxiredoxin
MSGEIKFSKRFIFVFFVGVIIAAFLGIAGGQYFNEWRQARARAELLKKNPPTTLKEGDIIPNLSFVTLEGKEQMLYQQLQYDRAMVLLLSTTCGFCAKEIEKWKEQMASLPSGIQMLGISNEPLEKLLTYSQEMQLPFPLLCDQEGKFFKQYDVKSYPILALVDESKKISKLHFGFDPNLRVKDYLETLAVN